MDTTSAAIERLINGRIAIPAIEAGRLMGWSPEAARQRIRRGTFPMPTTSLTNGRKITIWVAAEDLRAFAKSL